MATKLGWGLAMRGAIYAAAASGSLRRSCRGLACGRTMLLRAGLWGSPRPAGVQPRHARVRYVRQGWAAQPKLSGM